MAFAVSDSAGKGRYLVGGSGVSNPFTSFKPSGRTVVRFMRDDNFVRGLMGPFGSGKSTGCIFEIVRRSMPQPVWPDGKIRARWAVIRNTYPELKTTTIKSWHQWFPQTLGRWQENGPPTHWLEFESPRGLVEIEVMFLALDRPEDVAKLLSMELTGAWVNETREVPWPVIQGLQGRVGRYPPKNVGGPAWYGIIMDTNPPDTDSDWYRIFEEERPEGFAIFKQPSGLSARAENVENLPDGYYQRMISGNSDQWIRVHVHGQYGYSLDGKVVFPEFDDTLNVAARPIAPIPGLRIVIGADAGRTPALTFWQKTPLGQVRGIIELIGDNVGARAFARSCNALIAERFPDRQAKDFIASVDPSAVFKHDTDESTWAGIMEDETGIRFEPASTNNLGPRLEVVKDQLTTMVDGQTPGVLISPEMKVTRKAFNSGYRYKRVQSANGARYENDPWKNEYSHPMDSAQYAFLHMTGSYEALVRRNSVRKGFETFQAQSDFRVM